MLNALPQASFADDRSGGNTSGGDALGDAPWRRHGAVKDTSETRQVKPRDLLINIEDSELESFTNGEAPTKNPTVAKNYIYARYGIPAVTFEAGDETDRAAVRAAAPVFAEELMRLMLKQEY